MISCKNCLSVSNQTIRLVRSILQVIRSWVMFFKLHWYIILLSSPSRFLRFDQLISPSWFSNCEKCNSRFICAKTLQTLICSSLVRPSINIVSSCRISSFLSYSSISMLKKFKSASKSLLSRFSIYLSELFMNQLDSYRQLALRSSLKN